MVVERAGHPAEIQSIAFAPERIVLVERPGKSTKLGGFLSKDSLTEATGKPVIGIATTQDPAEYSETLQKTLEPGDLVIVNRGDGDTHYTGKAILELPADQGSQIAMFPVRGGSACDFATMVNRAPRYRKNPLHVLRDGRMADSWVLHSLTQTEDQEPEENIGLAYISTGLTALPSHLFNQDAHRKSMLRRLPLLGIHLQELVTTLQAVQQREAYLAESDAGQHLEISRLYATGHRMARLLRLPGRLNDRPFFEANLTGNDIGDIAEQFGKLVLGNPDGKFATNSSFTVLTPTWIQHDGEAALLPAHTQVAIRTHDRPLKVFTTNRN